MPAHLKFQGDSFKVEEKPVFPGSRSKFTEKLDILYPEKDEGIPVYRVMDRHGKIIDGALDPKVMLHSKVQLLTSSINSNL